MAVADAAHSPFINIQFSWDSSSLLLFLYSSDAFAICFWLLKFSGLTHLCAFIFLEKLL